ncbi:MAG: sugar phosphate isomerase/epimerase [Planctomycetes bacterium]|nr:sugar phosphate isomerase/epimerase [Planctomycetota bacterium]
MRLINSVCTTVMFPPSRREPEYFRRTAAFLAGRGVDCLEFYYDGPVPGDALGRALTDAGLAGIFIAVIPSKEKKLWLCDPDEDARRAAMGMHRQCLDLAWENGLSEFMICSGAAGADVDRRLDQLAKSVAELHDYADQKGQPIRLLLEPCDETMQACNVLGPYQRSVAFTERMNRAGHPLELTMDSAHSAEIGEDFTAAVRAARPWCRHVHFANCDISTPGSDLYGDKHVGFEYPGTVWTPATLAQLFADLQELYPDDEELRIGIEILCREDDPFAYYDKTWSLVPFLHKEPKQ